MAEEPSQKYLTYADHPFEIEEADEELLLRATALITADVQDAKQRWRDAACQIIATKDRRIAELEAKLAALEPLLRRAIIELEYIQCVENCHSGLCATSEGKAIVESGTALLGLKDLADPPVQP